MSFLELRVNNQLFSINTDKIIEIVKDGENNTKVFCEDGYRVSIPVNYFKFMENLSLVHKIVKENCNDIIQFYSFRENNL